MHIGILGGSFDPVHLGHLIMAQDALERFDLDRALFVPAAQPPHKAGGPRAAAEHRMAMLAAAIEGQPDMEISPLEIERGGVSYSVDTVADLQQRRPRDVFSFIIGADTLRELHTWTRVEELLDRCRFLTLCRPGYPVRELTPERLRLPPARAAQLLRDCVSGHEIQISSSDIRMRLAEGLPIRYLVHPAVEMYIAEHRLYQ